MVDICGVRGRVDGRVVSGEGEPLERVGWISLLRVLGVYVMRGGGGRDAFCDDDFKDQLSG